MRALRWNETPIQQGKAASGVLVFHSRVSRFVIVGCTAGAIQLALMSVLVGLDVPAWSAELAAFALAAQANFVMSSRFTWADRGDPSVRRWMAFMLSVALSATMNFAVFAVAQDTMPVLVASALGIVAGAGLNFIAGDRAVFRRPAAAVIAGIEPVHSRSDR